jgi:hypothetical protein
MGARPEQACCHLVESVVRRMFLVVFWLYDGDWARYTRATYPGAGASVRNEKSISAVRLPSVTILCPKHSAKRSECVAMPIALLA